MSWRFDASSIFTRLIISYPNPKTADSVGTHEDSLTDAEVTDADSGNCGQCGGYRLQGGSDFHTSSEKHRTACGPVQNGCVPLLETESRDLSVGFFGTATTVPSAKPSFNTTSLKPRISELRLRMANTKLTGIMVNSSSTMDTKLDVSDNTGDAEAPTLVRCVGVRAWSNKMV